MGEKSKEKSKGEGKYEEYALESDFEVSQRHGIKERLAKLLDSHWWNGAVIALVAIIAFGVGRSSALEDGKEPLRVVANDQTAALGVVEVKEGQGRPPSPAASEAGGRVVGSKNGTKYHFPWCGGAKQISEKNLITFNSIEEARAKGYTPAANCKGLK